ncbi:GNAT family N-acetyltransferase [Mesorhizobium sp. B2-4-13]|uniref:GNAT family N-acetyltransferase n=1 Tax=Mesorhizobium sp. B2-4-13 TaxID=2589936 RepID=UPI00114E63C7|nr:GNAT family N-acetyltransferase [Mesorhizobium sp. B2-4-13]TPK87043.1 GNAT family N-acetyltransferase [Mesorhizobium sp. B2-4-13]
MMAVAPSDIGLRRATGNDEAFVLYLEGLATRKLAEAAFGRWIPRPGMGASFPEATCIIQVRNSDVGCFTIHERYNVVEIDQFYLHPEAQGFGVDKHVLERIVTFAAIEHELVETSLIAGSDAQELFTGCGFKIIEVSAKRIRMEYAVSRKITTWIN